MTVLIAAFQKPNVASRSLGKPRKPKKEPERTDLHDLDSLDKEIDKGLLFRQQYQISLV